MNQFLVACSLKYTWRPIPPEPYVPGSVMFDSETPWSVTSQAPLSMEFSRQEYWTGLPFSPPGDLPNPGIEPVSPALAGKFFTTAPPGKPYVVFGEMLIYIFRPFFFFLLDFLFLLSFMSCLYILEINPLSVASFANIFLPF